MGHASVRTGWLILALSAGAAFSLAGCGPGGVTTTPVMRGNAPVQLAGTYVQRATVVLPAGSSLVPSQLSVKNSLGLTQPAADGTFSVTQFVGGPQFAFVTDPAGEAILAGFLGGQDTTIDATSTAKVFIYWSAGLFTLPGPYRAQTIDALPSQPGFSAVSSAFANAVAANPDPFSTAMNRVAVVTAIRTFTASLYAAPGAMAARLKSLGVRRPGDVSVNPATAVSGITAVNDPGGVHLVNTYRRSAEAFFDEDSYVDAQGNRNAKHVSDVAPPLPVAPVANLTNASGGPISVALGLLGGSAAYDPVTTSTVPLANEPGAQSTRYLVTVVGAGKPNPNVTLTAEQIAAQNSVVVEQLAQDYLVPLVASITVPVDSATIDAYLESPQSGGALAQVTAAVQSLAPQIYPVLNGGDMAGALTLAMDAVASNPPVQTQLLQLVGNLISSTDGQAAAQAFQNGYSPLYALDVLSAMLLSNDTSVASANIAASDEGDVFVVDVNAGTVTLTPSTAKLADNGPTQTFTAQAPSPPAGQSIVYQWANTATSGHLTDGTPGHTDNFQSTSSTVTYTPATGGSGSDTITVTAFDVQGSVQTQTGTPAAASVSVVCPFAGVFSGPLNDGRFNPALVSQYTATFTCMAPNIVNETWTDPSYGSGGFNGTSSGLTVTSNDGTVTAVFSANYNTISVAEPNAMQTGTLTRVSGP